MRTSFEILWLASSLAVGLPWSDSREDLFGDRIAPILESRCIRCHGGEEPRGKLVLSSAEGLAAGSENGPIVVPGEPEESVLLDVISGESPTMPQGDDPLSASEVEAIRTWIAAGAAWPDGQVLQPRNGSGSAWWSLRPLVKPAVPALALPPGSNPVDAFLLDRLCREGLSPSPEADRQTLIRRLTFDLHGLPPAPAEVEAFVQDRSPDAYGRLVDRLLASPRYGERWGRHWLDLAHYADTHGYDKDKRRDHAWPYRDWVVQALNSDLPYDEFVRLQLAADALRPEDADALPATGFVVAGPWDFVGQVELREGTVDKEKTRLLDRDDMVANACSTFLSLTVHCARCHDHKFDPIPQRDYYRLQAVFSGVERGDRPWHDAPLASEKARRDSTDESPLAPSLTRLPEDSTGQLASPPPRRQYYGPCSIPPRPIHVLSRGDVEQPGERVAPGALSCLDPLLLSSTFELPPDASDPDRRAGLAAWITDPRNPLTWRSIVNRVWHHHFGRGLVDTPSDFGRNGSKPSHPELLDWLAVTFRDDLGQSLKNLHRLIVTSAAYRQASSHRPDPAARDAENRLLWRQNRRRLEAEAVRDAVLAVSGTLDSRMGGPGFALFRYKDDHSPLYDHDDPAWIDPADGRRRSIYRFAVRSVTNPFLDCLDGPDPNIGVPVRNETITPLQALALLNDPFMIAQAEAFASRLEAEEPDPSCRVERAFRLGLGRPPTAVESERLKDYASRHGLAATCRLLFNLNEFVLID